MPTIQADPASPAPWRQSLRRSQERRQAAARLRRRRFRGRSVAILMGVVMTAGGGAALAAGGSTTLLHRGSHGSTIAAVQRALGIPADGVYNFSSASYNDTQLFIDDNKIADNEGALSLLKGYHTIKIKNFYTAPVPGARRRSNPAIRIYMIAPGTMDKKLVTADMLYN